MNTKTRKIITISYYIIAIFLIGIGYWFSASPKQSLEIAPIGFVDMLFIFSYNFAFMVILMIFSFTGIPIIFMISFLISMGESAKSSGIDPIIYYTASFTHGFLEITLSFIIIIFSIIHIKRIFNYLFNKKNLNTLSNFYSFALKKTLPLIALICFLGALTEVYISNPLIRLLTN